MIQALDKIKHKDSKNFFLIAGPCAIESEDLAMEVAEKSSSANQSVQYPVYLQRFFLKKANRSRVDSFTGIGDVTALEILKKSR